MSDFKKEIWDRFVQDVAVEITDKFDQNFSDKAFFGEKWKNSPNGLIKQGHLSNSFKPAEINGDKITWSSSMPYASIHNEGGEIEVTEKMKRYFWAMYYKATGAASPNPSKGGGQKKSTKRQKNLTVEAQQWKNLALMKVGQKIKIEKRQFIGDHPQVRQGIETVWNDLIGKADEHFKKILNFKK